MKKFLVILWGLFLFICAGVKASGVSEDFNVWAQSQISSCPVLGKAWGEGKSWRAEQGRQLNCLVARIPSEFNNWDSVQKKLQDLQKGWAESVVPLLSKIPAAQKGFPLRTTKTALNITLALEKMEDKVF